MILQNLLKLNEPFIRSQICWISLIIFILQHTAVFAQDEYSFDLEDFEKKSFEWGGYVELKFDHVDVNGDGAFTLLNMHREPRSFLDRISSTIQLDGNYNRGKTTLKWVMQATAEQDQLGWKDNADIFEAYASIKPTPMATIDLGKKVFKWGKGYAWNPVGFINRPKDPSNPEEALEGFIGAGVDYIRSFPGDLQTVALTTVALPVWEEVNEDFGEKDNVNLAAKLYLLYKDTDIDLIWYTGNSRSTRYGIDFSRNLATNFEIHGELAHVPSQKGVILNQDGTLSVRETADTSYLLGLRYLTKNDMTTILEFYHNDDGYSETEMDRFFMLVDDANSQFLATGSDFLFQKALMVSKKGYGKPQPGRNYLYTRINQKEPFDILYFTPGITAIINLDDTSYSISPEAVYTGFTNWEIRLRFSLINGAHYSEHGEKLNSNKLEMRVRYFF